MQQPVQIVQQPAPTTQQRGVRKGFAHKTITAFGIVQIISGTLAIICCSVTLAMECNSGVSYSGTGIWAGTFIIVSGSIGCGNGYKKSNCMIIANMVLLIITAVFAGTVLLPVSAVGIARERVCARDIGHWLHCDYNRYATCVASHSINLVISIIVAIIAIIGASLCCRAVCCRHGSERAMYLVQSGQPGNVPIQYPMVTTATSQGASMVCMMPATEMQLMTSQGIQHQPAMVVPGYIYQQQQQPTLMMAQAHVQPQPMPQQQAYAVQQLGPQGQQNADADLGMEASFRPPSYSSTPNAVA